MKKLALSVAVATATVGSVEAQAATAFFNFEALQQTIECIRKPGTDYLVCSNKFVPADDEEEETTPEPVVEPTPEPTGRYYFSEASEVTIAQDYFPAVHDLAPAYDYSGVPNTDLGAIEIADFDQNGLDDVVLDIWWKKGRQWTDPEVCGQTSSTGTQRTCFENLDHEEEQWNESWSSVVVLLQKEPGVWEVGNRELFGYDRPSFGTMGRKTQVGDFNQDGYPDYMMSGGWEDGRAPSRLDPDDRWSPPNWGSSPQKVMISNGDGTFRMEELGVILNAHGGTAAKMQNGQWHVINHSGRVSDRYYRDPDLTFTYQGVDGLRLGQGALPAQVRTWYNGEQEPVENYPYLNWLEFRASEPEEINGKVYSRYLIDSSSNVGWKLQTLEWCLNNRKKCDDSDGPSPGISYHYSNWREWGGEGLKHGFVLWEQIDSEWVEVDTYVWGTETDKRLRFYDGSDRTLVGDERPINDWPVIDYGDTWGLSVSSADGCSIKMYPDSDPIFIFGMDGMRIPKGTPEPLDFDVTPSGDFGAGTYTYKAVGLVDGELTEIDIWPDGNTATTGRVFHCDDINGDGYDDLTAKSSEGFDYDTPLPEFVVWLNDQNGGLVKTKIQVDNPETDFSNGEDINAEAALGEASEYYGEGFGGSSQVIRDVNGDGIGDLVSFIMTTGAGSDKSQYPKFTVRYGINPQEIQ